LTIDTLKRLLKEPLLHFLAIGGLLFLAYGQLNEATPETDDKVIIVSSTRIEQIKKGFNAVWNHLPNDQELKGLIEQEIRQEVYYRDALDLGLDKNDEAVRRRLRQKLEFLSDTGNYLQAPAEGELEAYYAANQQKYQQEPRLSFEQIFLGENPSEKLTREALESLKSDARSEPYNIGVRSLLPGQMKLARPTAIDNTFGPGFYATISNFSPGKWDGPVQSSYGVHLVRTLSGLPGRLPQLSEIRNTVFTDWQASKIEQAREQDYARRRAQYQIEIQRDGLPGST